MNTHPPPSTASPTDFLSLRKASSPERGYLALDIRVYCDISNLMDRFWNKVEKTDTCWLWAGALDSNGYGVFYFKGRLEKAHRFAWMLSGRKLQSDKELHHKCENKRCVRLAHLRYVSRVDHSRLHDRPTFNRYRSATLVTHCEKGHEYTPENTGKQKTGRFCKQCAHDRYMRRRYGT